MSFWEQALLGITLLLILLFLGPGAKKAMEESRQAENPDWKGVLIPLVMVVLFVILLISMTQG